MKTNFTLTTLKDSMKNILKVATFSALALTLVACGGGGGNAPAPEENGGADAAAGAMAVDVAVPDDPVLKAIQDKGELVVSTSADYPPFEFHVLEDGEDKIVGFDIDIAQAIADTLGVKLTIKDLDFDAVIPSLVSGQADLAIAGLVPTPERDEVVDFTDIYYQTTQMVIIRKEDQDKYKTPEDFAGKKVGAQTATTQETVVLEQFPEDVVLSSNSKLNNLIMEVKNKTSEGLVIAGGSGEQYVAVNDDLVMVDMGIPPEDGNAIAAPDGETGALAFYNEVLKKLMDEGKVEEYIQNNSELASKAAQAQ
ncbi:MAG: transporter substrate-binding domain-containing protein [Tissierellia bacterium]|nr:transporter substrate-binding domain-containing protein [Tissierellia bacterium]